MRILDGRESFYQWDLNQKITSNKFKVGYEIQFTNGRQQKAPVVLTYELDGKVVAEVPNNLLQSAFPITAYIYVDDRTVGEYTFGVIQRPKPDDYVYIETEVWTYKDLDERIKALEKGGTGGGYSARISEVVLTSEGWKGDTSPYSQVVDIEGVTPNSQVDLTPSIEQLSVFYQKDLAFVTENENGVVTVYSLGDKPQNDYVIQVTITEVSV